MAPAGLATDRFQLGPVFSRQAPFQRPAILLRPLLISCGKAPGREAFQCRHCPRPLTHPHRRSSNNSGSSHLALNSPAARDMIGLPCCDALGHQPFFWPSSRGLFARLFVRALTRPISGALSPPKNRVFRLSKIAPGREIRLTCLSWPGLRKSKCILRSRRIAAPSSAGSSSM